MNALHAAALLKASKGLLEIVERSNDGLYNQTRTVIEARAAIRMAEPMGPLARKIAKRKAVKAGMEKARAEGKKIGRPRFELTRDKQATLRLYHALPEGKRWTYHELAGVLGCSVGMAYRLARQTQG